MDQRNECENVEDFKLPHIIQRSWEYDKGKQPTEHEVFKLVRQENTDKSGEDVVEFVHEGGAFPLWVFFIVAKIDRLDDRENVENVQETKRTECNINTDGMVGVELNVVQVDVVGQREGLDDSQQGVNGPW